MYGLFLKVVLIVIIVKIVNVISCSFGVIILD